MVTRRIEAAQKKVEERNFEIRKNLLEYDEVMDEQRKRVYGYRQRILDGVSCRDLIIDMIREQIDHYVDMFLDRDYGVDTFAKWAGARLSTTLDPRDYRGMDFASAEIYAKEQAERMAETQVLDAIEENLPEEEDAERMELGSTGQDGRHALGPEPARPRPEESRPGQRRRAADREGPRSDPPHRPVRGSAVPAGGFRRALDRRLGQEPSSASISTCPRSATWKPRRSRAYLCELAERKYDEKEAEYPVMAGLYRFATGAGNARIDRDALVDWARERFEVELDLEDLKNKQRDEIRAVLLVHSRDAQQRAVEALSVVKEKVDALFPAAETHRRAGPGRTAATASWSPCRTGCKTRCAASCRPTTLEKLRRDELEQTLCNAVEDRYRPEMRRMERALLLSLVDTAWKDHLLAMDHLRSAVGLKG